MDIKNQQGGLVAKQKNQQPNPRKVLEQKINEVGSMMSMCIQKIQQLDQMVLSCETLIVKLTEFMGNKDDFDKYLKNWVEEENKKEAKKEPAKNQ